MPPMKVLLATDDEAVREQLPEALRRGGHDVVVISEAEARSGASVPECPVAIVDLRNGGPEKVELCRQLRQLTKGRRSFLLALVDPETLDRWPVLLGCGVDDWVMDPQDRVALKCRLDRVERGLKGASAERLESRLAAWGPGATARDAEVSRLATASERPNDGPSRETGPAIPELAGQGPGGGQPGEKGPRPGDPSEALRRLVELYERERRLLAYEIHDGLIQNLTAALFRLQSFEGLIEKQPGEARNVLQSGIDSLRRSIDDARRLIGGLSPPALEESGLREALQYLVGDVTQRTGKRVELRWDVPVQRLSSSLERTAFRLVQESLNNAVRHSGSERIVVEVKQSGGKLSIRVEDWGVGFDPAAVPPDRFGLRGIRDRARLLGGRAEIDSRPGEGTRVQVELPLSI
ncbi:MAG TPA: hypothetical protein EYH34_05150 [Planctomycetes bacterium]|nr:hypothetical protein [Planctomycetota bacterium]